MEFIKMEQYNQDLYNNLSGGIIFFIFAFIFIVILISTIISFKDERDYIKMEIERSTSEKELSYWNKELRKLYLRKIPIFGMFFSSDEDDDDE